MPIPPYLALAGIQAGTSILGYALRGRTPDFEDTAYAKYLKEQERTGKFSPEYVRKELARIGAVAGTQAQISSAELQGRLASRGGSGSSITDARALARPGLAAARTVSEASAQFGIENARSKFQAKQEYERLKFQGKMAQSRETAAARSQLFSGIAGAAGTAIAGKISQDRFEAQMDLDREKQAALEAYRTGTLEQREVATAATTEFRREQTELDIAKQAETTRHNLAMERISEARISGAITKEQEATERKALEAQRKENLKAIETSIKKYESAYRFEEKRAMGVDEEGKPLYATAQPTAQDRATALINVASVVDEHSYSAWSSDIYEEIGNAIPEGKRAAFMSRIGNILSNINSGEEQKRVLIDIMQRIMTNGTLGLLGYIQSKGYK